MAPGPLARKLQLKPGFRVAVVNPPDGYTGLLEPLPDGAELVEGGTDLDALQVFVHDADELERLAPAFGSVRPDGLLWICYPKGGRRAGTDLNRDLLWQRMETHGLAGVTLVSVDDTWSAMRFRPPDRVGT